MMPIKRRKQFTVEQMADDCIDVHEINRANMLCNHWVTAPFSFRRPKIAKMHVARYRIILYLLNLTTPQQIPVSWTKCRYGGARPWLHCPHCARRVAKLYLGLGGYFCRRCLGNRPYASQTKSTAGRKHYRACKLRLQLGASASPGEPLPERPLGMQRVTYERRVREIQDLESGLRGRLKTKAPDYRNLVAYFR